VSTDTRVEPDGPTRPSPAALSTEARVAGVVAALVALAVTELIHALSSRVPSLVIAVGDVFVDGLPGDVTRSVIGAIGTADKPALLIGIVVVAALIGAATGKAALRRPWVGHAVFAVFAVLGALAGMRDPLASDGGAIVAATAGGLAGAFTLRLLLAAATQWAGPSGPSATVDDAGRRQFLLVAGAIGTMAAVVGLGGRSLARRFNVEGARRDVVLPTVRGGTRPTAADAGLDVDGITPFVTPNADFYRIDTALSVPQVDPADWTLTIDGMVDEPFELTFAELLDLPLVEKAVTIACVSNEVGGELVGNARWLGVPLRTLLDRAGVQDGATQLMGHSVDGFTAGFPTELLDDEDRPALVAVGMNGEPLPIEHGFPARLIIGGIYGYVSATKWLSRIELTTLDAADGYWIPRGWAKEAPIKTQCRIDTPRGSRSAGRPVPIAGVAWAPTRGIAKVEVQVDDGPWQEAELGPGTTDDTWRQWFLDWRPDPGTYELRARATDGEGETQTEESAPPAPDGATGYPTAVIEIS
jgi:DMSO/TMAO reductase YedYZ molybdopterin-dependent catalytic subunit